LPTAALLMRKRKNNPKKQKGVSHLFLRKRERGSTVNPYLARKKNGNRSSLCREGEKELVSAPEVPRAPQIILSAMVRREESASRSCAVG